MLFVSLIFDFNKVSLLKSKIRDTNKQKILSISSFPLKSSSYLFKRHKKHRIQKAYKRKDNNSYLFEEGITSPHTKENYGFLLSGVKETMIRKRKEELQSSALRLHGNPLPMPLCYCLMLLLLCPAGASGKSIRQ